ncbi:hypothetical protein PALB_15150 [Pseudoalteromonas luteoviolacea B = ATCC 29581]|nr:hypothetical protein PALB_15150 [Pseudoalteromonas luteoviolacea B = ATCC 29581]
MALRASLANCQLPLSKALYIMVNQMKSFLFWHCYWSVLS